MALRAHLLIKNNEDTIEQSIQSLLPLECEIIAGDLGGCDKTAAICAKYGVKVIRVGQKNDYSVARNQLLGEDWNFYIQPWEVLASGHEAIKEVTVGTAYCLSLLQRQHLQYEIRLWRNLKFKNPIFETIIDDSSTYLDAIIYTLKLPPDPDLEILDQWKKRGAIEPYYYESFVLLSNKRHKEFLETAKYYLTASEFDKPAIMLRYYMAQIYFHVYEDSDQAVKTLLPCIIAKPLMAEFWCLLGDVYYKQKKYNKAKNLYENAIILGTRRLKNDLWPVEIPKYSEYPSKMIRSCDQIRSETHMVNISGSTH